MSRALQIRAGVATAAVAFLGAVFTPLEALLRADIAGPFGAVPPVAAELLGLLLGPGLALVVGYRLAGRTSFPDRFGRLAAAVGLGSLVGSTAGGSAGSFLWPRAVASPQSPLAPVSIDLYGYLLWVLPPAVAVAVGTFGGVAVRRTRPGTHADGPTGRRSSWSPRTSLLALAGLAGAVAGFASFVQPFAFLLSTGETALTGTAYATLASVGVPLVTAALATRLGVTPADLRARDLTTVGVAALGGHLVGYALGYGFVVANRPSVLDAMVRTRVVPLAVAVLVSTTVVVLAVLAGIVLSGRSTGAASTPA